MTTAADDGVGTNFRVKVENDIRFQALHSGFADTEVLRLEVELDVESEVLRLNQGVTGDNV